MMNAFELTQIELFEDGRMRTEIFFRRNRIPVPRYICKPLPTTRKPQGSYGCGHFIPSASGGTIWVNPTACAKPSQGNGRQRSFPGYRTDRTPVGVVAHEAGHAVDAFTNLSSRADWFALCEKQKDRISSYEPDPSEAFAETMRIFILNPTLLQVISPARFGFLDVRLKCTARVEDPRFVLMAYGAPATYLQMVKKWAQG